MTSFVISTVTTAAQTLATGEVGYVSGAGGIIVEGTAVTLAGSARLTVVGEVASMRSAAVTMTDLSGGALTVGAAGTVSAAAGTSFAVSGSFAGSFAIRNAGSIMGGQGISMTTTLSSAKLLVDNSGTIDAASASNGTAVLVNTVAGTEARVFNTGSIIANGSAGLQTGIETRGAGDLRIANSGDIVVTGMAIFANGGLNLTNTGHIIGAVQANGTATVVNSGIITGGLFTGFGNDTVTITGRVEGNVDLSGGNDTLNLRGGQVTGAILDGGGNDTYIIDRSDLQISDQGGNDTVISSASFRLIGGIEALILQGSGLTGTGTAGADRITGDTGAVLRGLGGADNLIMGNGGGRVFGGHGNDTVTMGAGDDNVAGGAGDDLIKATVGGDDTVDGGDGVDTLTFGESLSSDPIVINMTSGTATIAGQGTAQFSGIEAVSGSFGADVVTGNAGDNTLSGSAGNDSLVGGGGDDRLLGDGGSDTLAGGAGADTFQFRFASDSDGTASTDLIQGFQLAVDKIDLAFIDPVSGGADDSFVFLGGAAFTVQASGQVRFFADGATTVVEVRLGGATVNSLEIVLDTVVALTADHFVL